jgi:hypothetical protein
LGRTPVKNGQGIAGVIGADLFERYVVVVDYDHGSMEMMPPLGFSARDGSAAIVADWRTRVPIIRARIALHGGLTIEARLIVDTGTVEPLVLRPSFAAAYGIVSGTRIRTLELGRLALRDWPVALSATVRGPLSEADGTIGAATLRRFQVTFDRERNRLFLRPGALFNIPYDYDASGLRIVANGDEFGVGNILGGYASPREVPSGEGSEALFHIGDVILEFDGRSVTGVTLDVMRAMFKADGSHHTVTVRRHGALQKISYDAPVRTR